MDEILLQLLPAIEEQLKSPETPYVRETFDRLIQDPEIDEDEAKAMLAFCLADEVEMMQDHKRLFDADRYQLLLQLLPIMPEGR